MYESRINIRVKTIIVFVDSQKGVNECGEERIYFVSLFLLFTPQ